MNRDIQLRLHNPNLCAKKVLADLILFAGSCALGLLVSSPSYSQEKVSATPPQQPPTQKTFKTPQEAADAFIQATASFDVPALTQILGPQGEDLIASEDQVRDKNSATGFAAKAHEKTWWLSVRRTANGAPWSLAMTIGHADPHGQAKWIVAFRYQGWAPGGALPAHRFE